MKIVILCLALLFTPEYAGTLNDEEPNSSGGRTEMYAVSSPENPIAHKELIDCLIKYESGGIETAVGDGGKAYGVLQYHEPTFEAFRASIGQKYMEYKNPRDQIVLTDIVLADTMANLGHWTTRHFCTEFT